MGRSTGESPDHRDVIVIGSGFGGSLAAWPLVHAGLDVLMLERGPWVARGPDNWEPDGTLIRTPYFNGGSEFVADTLGGRELTASCSCVGGASVFYGAVSLRYREEDFLPDPEIVTDSGSEWPFGYEDLRPYYLAAERILGVAGKAGVDPTEPPRERGYVAAPTRLSEVSRRIGDGARSLGLRPFPLPLAISFRGNGAERAGAACVECSTCDTFACAVGAKNDIASRVIPTLVRRGLEVRAETAVTRLACEGDRVVGVEARGFIFGAAVAYRAGAGFVPVRKKGKLPHETLAVRYELEYGTDEVEMHADGVRRGERVLVVDDLIATGGTAAASVRLARAAGGEVIGCSFLIELSELRGLARLDVDRTHVVLRY